MYKVVLIGIHQIFICMHRRKLNALLKDGNIVLSDELLKISRILDYHCDRVLMLKLCRE